MATLLLNGKKLDMEVDTGAALSVLSEATRRAMFPDDTLDPSSLVLKTYTDEHMKVKGTLNVRVEYGEQKEKVVLVIVNSKSPSLMGRNWLKYIHLNWKNIFAMRTAKMKPLNSLLQGSYSLKIWAKIHSFAASLEIQPNATPRYCKSRPVPFGIKDAISQELNRLEQLGIISPLRGVGSGGASGPPIIQKGGPGPPIFHP